MTILLGFPKSGTTSFHNLFKSIGIESYHQNYRRAIIACEIYKNYRRQKPLFCFIKRLNNTAITQLDICHSNTKNLWPQITLYEEIYTQYKDSIFILNTRNPENILSSFKRWIYLNKSYFERFILYNYDMIKDLEGNNDEEKFIKLINIHYENIRIFFKNKNAKFIEFDIEHDNISKLSKYINLKGINKFPHSNKN